MNTCKSLRIFMHYPENIERTQANVMPTWHPLGIQGVTLGSVERIEQHVKQADAKTGYNRPKAPDALLNGDEGFVL